MARLATQGPKFDDAAVVACGFGVLITGVVLAASQIDLVKFVRILRR